MGRTPPYSNLSRISGQISAIPLPIRVISHTKHTVALRRVNLANSSSIGRLGQMPKAMTKRYSRRIEPKERSISSTGTPLLRA